MFYPTVIIKCKMWNSAVVKIASVVVESYSVASLLIQLCNLEEDVPYHKIFNSASFHSIFNKIATPWP